MKPQFPLISIHDFWPNLIKDEVGFDQTILTGLFADNSSERYYDVNGNVWLSTISPKGPQPTWLQKLLAKTVYNPIVPIERYWEKIGSYEFSELQTQINQCIDHDDDLLTQFIEADELKSKITLCRDFEELVETLERYVFTPEE